MPKCKPKIETNEMSMAHEINDCFLHDKDRLRHDEAIALLASRLPKTTLEETVGLDEATGRILAADIAAPHMVPLHTNAAVDGYAFCHANLQNEPEGTALAISQRIAAGHLAPSPLKAGTAARIFTGAVMPIGADTVAMQEDCVTNGSTVTLPMLLKKGANCRLAGEDLKQGERVLTAGSWLKSSHIAAAASVGAGTLPVQKKLRVALISNGDELRDAQDHFQPTIQPGEVFDTNGPMLRAAVADLPVTVSPMGIVGDSLQTTEAALQKAVETADVIVTSGGASRGEEDHMLTALDRLGKTHLWQLAIKPGRPMMMGQIPRQRAHSQEQSTQAALPDCLYFGLPGNPVAAFVCFLLYVRPSLLALAGAPFVEAPRYTVKSGFEIASKKPDRREFLRARLSQDADGSLVAHKFERDGSGLISSLRTSDGLVEIDEKTTQVAKGDAVRFLPFPTAL